MNTQKKINQILMCFQEITKHFNEQVEMDRSTFQKI